MNIFNSYLNIDTSIIKSNIVQILEELPEGSSLIPVLKDDAYGLGCIEIAKLFSEFDKIKYIAVAHISEGIELAKSGVNKDILLIANPVKHLINDALQCNIIISVGSKDILSLIPKDSRIMVMIDSGLHRNGFTLDSLPDFSNYNVLGCYSHFADGSNEELCLSQYNEFNKVQLPGIKHISASLSFEHHKEYSMDAVRIGRRLYMDEPGVYSSNIKEAVSWRTYITDIRHLPAGSKIGYNQINTLTQDSTLANIGVGYGDGLCETSAKFNAPVLINGVKCKIVSCFMDQALADVTNVKCSLGDEVTIFGYDNNGNYISSQWLASLLGENEGVGLYSKISPRVKRIYT